MGWFLLGICIGGLAFGLFIQWLEWGPPAPWRAEPDWLEKCPVGTRVAALVPIYPSPNDGFSGPHPDALIDWQEGISKRYPGTILAVAGTCGTVIYEAIDSEFVDPLVKFDNGALCRVGVNEVAKVADMPLQLGRTHEDH